MSHNRVGELGDAILAAEGFTKANTTVSSLVGTTTNQVVGDTDAIMRAKEKEQKMMVNLLHSFWVYSDIFPTRFECIF